jgi:peptidoglycan/LPS O-acetylase OafA/YrhL
MVVAAVVFFRTPYLCFIVGHIAAVAALAERPSRLPAWLCIVGIATGILLCVAGEKFAVPGSEAVCTANIPFMLDCDLILHFQKRIGALLIFLAVINWESARGWLSLPLLVRLGRISFPVYLVHWPIVFGPCCLIWLGAVALGLPGIAASIVAIVAGIALTIAVVIPFGRIDTTAQAISRDIRRGRAVASDAAA